MFNYSYNTVYLVSLYIYIQGHGEIILAQSKLNFPGPYLKIINSHCNILIVNISNLLVSTVARNSGNNLIGCVGLNGGSIGGSRGSRTPL